MLERLHTANGKIACTLFCVGWAAVMLSLTAAIPPVWNTFIHGWRVEFTTSIFLLTTLAFAAWSNRHRIQYSRISRDELNLLVLPICAFIVWSALSILWAPSSKSALHHTLVWSMYLIFYLAVREILGDGSNYGKLMSMLAGTLGFFGILAVAAYCTYLIFGAGTQLGMVYAKYGEQINTLFPLLLVGVLRQNGKPFNYGLGILAAWWLLIFCGLGRTNLLLFAVATLVMAVTIFSFKQFHRYRQKILIIGLVFVVAPVPFHLFSLLSDKADIPIVERVSDTGALSSSNGFRKLMIAISMEMFAAHPVTGIGADNFGLQANRYRAEYSAKNQDDGDLVHGENTIPERAHNEYLQILAELGVVGAAIFLWLLVGIGVMVFRAIRRRRKMSLYSIAAVLGITIFLISSLVTSYSFRLIQNGFVFFFVLAVAAKLLFKNDSQGAVNTSVSVKQSSLRFGYAAGIIACLLLFGYWSIRVSSVAYSTRANYTRDLNEASQLYRIAMRLDNENPEPRYFLGLRLVENGRYAEAVPYLQESIAIGLAPSADFSYLASAQSLNDDTAGAEKTFAAAEALYPRSTFVLARYAALLQENGKFEEAAIHLERGKRIDLRQTNTWWTMITVSPQAATDRAFQNKDFVDLMDLEPQTAMYAVKAEREIRHPEERFKF